MTKTAKQADSRRNH